MDLVTWNSLMSCCRWPMSHSLFAQMAQAALEPDDISYTALKAPWRTSLVALGELRRRQLPDTELLTDTVSALEAASAWPKALALGRKGDRLLATALLRCSAKASLGQEALEMRRQLGGDDVIGATA